MSKIVNIDCQFRRRIGCMALYLLIVASAIQPLSLYAQDQSDVKVITGTVVDEAGKPLATVLDIWLNEKKLGSATSGADGAFKIEVDLASTSPESKLTFSSDQGHSIFNLADTQNDSVKITLKPAQSQSSSPVWVRTFFATILPIIVCAIVFLAIRNRKRG